MPSKRATARRESAELIDIESRLAPFFPITPPADAHGRNEDAHCFED
jgi:hypothetical protein